MDDYYVYKETTGLIVMKLHGTAAVANRQATTGRKVKKGIVDINNQIFDVNLDRLINKPLISYTVNVVSDASGNITIAADGIDTLIISELPLETKLTVNGQSEIANPTLDASGNVIKNSGVVEFSVDLAGTYLLNLTNIHFKDTILTVQAL